MFSKQIRNVTLWCGLTLVSGVMMACSLTPNIPVVIDERSENLVHQDVVKILSVADPRGDISRYRFALSAFPRSDLLGLSLGRGRIYISYQLTQLALRSPYHRWMLRQTLAHEIAHELAGHADPSGALANRPSVESGI